MTDFSEVSINPRKRHLWTRSAETRDGNAILNEARQLSKMSEYNHLSDGELIRLAYWGVSGES